MQADSDFIRFLEEISLNALPSLQTVVYDGWLLRFANGLTGRANSVQMLYPGRLPLDEKIAFCEEVYRLRNQRTIFKLTEASLPAGIDAALDRRGYSVLTPVGVQTASTGLVEVDDGVLIEDRISRTWLDAFCGMADLSADRRATLEAILSHIVPRSAFARRIVAGEIVAVGLAVAEQGWIGLYDIRTADAHRRRGHGSAVMRSLMSWGCRNGADNAYLQVTKGNYPAEAMYEKLGFREAYTYWYRTKAS